MNKGCEPIGGYIELTPPGLHMHTFIKGLVPSWHLCPFPFAMLQYLANKLCSSPSKRLVGDLIHEMSLN